MNHLCKFFICLCMIFILCSCGNSCDNVLVEKTGIKYELNSNDSFYYPKEFEVDLSRRLNDSICFVRDEELIEFQKIVNTDDNLLEDLPLLYEGELEQNGAVKVSYTETVVDSGLKCFEYIGIYEGSGIYFKHLVYFNDQASYVLRYEAPKTLFDENIEDISLYLNSLVISQ